MSLDGKIQLLVARLRTEFNAHKTLINAKEPSLPGGGTTAQYLRGDKTWQDYIQSTNAGFVNSISTANHVLSGLQTVGGVAIGAGGRVLLVAQTDAKENGVWIVGSGAWARATDANTSARLAGYVATVQQGANIATAWRTTFKPTDTIGTNNVRWYRASGAEMVGGPLNYPVPALDGHLIFDKANRMPRYYDAVGVQWLSGNGVIQDTKANRLAMGLPAGNLIWRETDTGLAYMWDGAAWQSLAGTETTLARCRVGNVGGQNITSGGSSQAINFDTEFEDNAGMWSAGTPDSVVCPSDGKYLVIARAGLNSSGVTGIFHAQVNQSGSATSTRQMFRIKFQDFPPTHATGSAVFTCVAGDVLKLALFHNNGATQSTHASVQYGAQLDVIKLPDSQVVTARAVGALCVLAQTAAQSIPNATSTLLNLDSIIADTDGMADLANNRIVIQTDGYYDLKCTAAFAGAATNNSYRQSRIAVNGTEYFVARQERVVLTNTGHYGVQCGGLVLLHAGDLITGYAQHGQGAALNTAPNAVGGFVRLEATMRSDTPF